MSDPLPPAWTKVAMDGQVRVALSEYETVEVDLPADAVLALGATGMVTVGRSFGGTYTIRADSKVGVVRAGGVELTVRPKVGVRRFMFLLLHALGLPRWFDDEVDFDESDPLDAIVITAFAASAERALRRGPRSGYVSVEATQTALRGRIRTSDQCSRHFGLLIPVEVAYDDFTPDVIENQLLLGAVDRAKRLPSLPTSLRGRLRRLQSALVGVTPARSTGSREQVLYNRLNEHYRPAVELAQLILGHRSIELGIGAHAGGFSVDMNQLFETFLTQALGDSIRRIAGGEVRGQHRDFLDLGSTAPIRPDITWWRDGACRAVIDAKYKMKRGGARPEDLYQALAYATSMGLDKAHLVYASAARAGIETEVRRSPIVICVHGIDLSLEPDQVRERIDDLARRIVCGARDGAG